MNKWLIALVVAVSMVTAAWAAPKLKKVGEHQVADMGNPVFFTIGNDGKPKLILVPDVVFMMREDGVVMWRMSDEATKRMEEEQAKGPKAPIRDYNSGRR